MSEKKRYYPDIQIGLTSHQVEERKKEHLLNYDTSVPTKSIQQILKENFITLFNIINLFLAIAIFAVGSYKNMFFLLIVILNTAISTFQEIHSKRIIDKLAVLASSKVTAIRDGKRQEIAIHEIVLDDILVLETGNQIATDSFIQEGEVEVDESFITGETDTLLKKKGDMLLSGSFISSGTCIAKVEHIAEENYTAQISSGAKYVKKVKSEIMESLNKIIKVLSMAIVPIGLILFWNQMHLPDATLQEAVVKSVAAIIGMIPEGLVLLTSTVLAVSVIRLSKNKVLVQELYCIETLARVDTLCLDKTGTLTEGKMEVKQIVSFEEDSQNMQEILANIAVASEDNNSTINALRAYFTEPSNKWIKTAVVPFSSKTKWSGISFKEQGSYVMGAPEFVLKKQWKDYEQRIQPYTKDYRVLVVAHTNENFVERELPDNLQVIGLVCIIDKIRKEAKETLQYFKEQGVSIKIISGDNPVTVSKIAKLTGVDGYENYIDMSQVEEAQIKEIASRYTIFGRVSPMQKKLLVEALKEKGKTVAMTGDGVNDVLALKESDCSIAMANGSDATKSVAQLVLLDSNFASMPKVVAEGRRTINNIQRSASLFLVKTIYSSVLAVLFIIIGAEYPFMPIQLSLISIVAIGIPSFLLALEPNKERIRGNFMKNVISKALPTALTVIIGVVSLALAHKIGKVPDEIYSSLCVITTGFAGILLLFTLARSRKSEHSNLIVSPFRFILSLAMTLLFVIGLTGLDWWFSIAPMESMWMQIPIIVIVDIMNFVVLNYLVGKLLKIEKIQNRRKRKK